MPTDSSRRLGKGCWYRDSWE